MKGNVPGWLSILETNLTFVVVVKFTAKFRRIALLNPAALVEGRVQPKQVIVNPACSGFSNEGDVGAFSFLLKDVRERVRITGGEASTKGFLIDYFCDVLLLSNKVDWRTNAKVIIKVVEIVDQIRVTWYGDSLIYRYTVSKCI